MATSIPDQSVFRRVGIGYVAEDLTPGSHNLEVLNVEWFAYSSGELNAQSTTLEYAGVDASGKPTMVKVEATITIEAKWYPGQNNRMTPPLVVKGERVELYQVSDTDQYYWRSMGVDEHLRKNDVMVFGVANKSERNNDPLDENNSYHGTIDTVNKLVSFHTGKSDGEKFSYDVQINAKEGTLLVSDDVGNQIHIDSNDARVEVRNSSGTSILALRDLLQITAGKVDINSKGSLNLNAAGGLNVSAASTKINSSSLTHNGKNVGASHTHGGVDRGNDSTQGPK